MIPLEIQLALSFQFCQVWLIRLFFFLKEKSMVKSYWNREKKRKSQIYTKEFTSLPPQFQICPSSVNTVVKKPPQETAATGMGSAFTLEGILSPPPSFGPRPGPRPNLPSPSSRPHV